MSNAERFQHWIVEEDTLSLHIRLHREPVNAVSRAVLEELSVICDIAASKRCLVLTGHILSPKSKPVFCAGADLAERRNMSDNDIMAHVRFQKDVILKYRALPSITVAVVDAYCAGFGTELLASTDIVFAKENASFSFPELSLGIIPCAGGTEFLAKSPNRGRAMLHALTSDTFGREEAETIGLVCAAFEDTLYSALLESLNKISPVALRAFKRAFREIEDGRRAVDAESEAYAECLPIARGLRELFFKKS